MFKTAITYFIQNEIGWYVRGSLKVLKWQSLISIEVPDWVQVKKNILYTKTLTDLLEIEYDHPIGCQSTTEFRNSRNEDIAITVKGWKSYWD